MTRLASFLIFFVASPIFFAIIAYSWFKGTAAPFLIAIGVLFGLPLISGIWLLLTGNRRRRTRDQEREQEFLEAQTGDKEEHAES